MSQVTACWCQRLNSSCYLLYSRCRLHLNTVLSYYCLYRKIKTLSEQLVLFKKTKVWLEAAFLVLVLNVSFRNPVPATGQKSPDPAVYTHV